MKVLMFGWEFPPMSSGGLGTACYGLTKGLSNQDVEVSFVLPYGVNNAYSDYVKLIPASGLKKISITGVNSLLNAYITSSQYQLTLSSKKSHTQKLYGKDLFKEVYRFAMKAALIAKHEDFDVIHCHDWMTYLAGIKAREVSGKPMVIHVHATEFDRTGGNVNQGVYDIERQGMHAANLIISVSQFTKNKIVEHYGISHDKVIVVHNATDDVSNYNNDFVIDDDQKIVLFVGRITIQKGPDYFIQAAKKCLEFDPNIRFIIAGSGDMEGYIIEKTAELGIADKVLFAGFLTDDKLDSMYRSADVYVMPSISEPFGLTPLEAMKRGTPVIISKQSGVSEVIQHCLKVDFWDIDHLVNQILSVLNHAELKHTLKHHGRIEVQNFNWNTPAKKCIEVYNRAISAGV